MFQPYFVTVLLRNIGTHVDPTVLIQKIEDGVVITGLRDSLVQIMLDYRLQVKFTPMRTFLCQRLREYRYLPPFGHEGITRNLL